MAVAVDVERIGADDVAQEFGIGADVERLLLEFERAAGFGFVDEQSRRVLAAGQEHRGKAGAVAIERRPAAADEELPRPVVDAVEARRFRLFMHEGHVAQRLLPVLAGAGAHKAGEKREDAERRSASLRLDDERAQERDDRVVLFGIERLIRVARKSRISAMRRDDFVKHAERAVVAVGRGRADAPEPWGEEHVAFDEALRLQFVAERVDRLIDDRDGA